MSGYSAWKQLERRAAKVMGGVRLWRPDYGDSAPDGESDTHTWDCKAYAKHAAVTLYAENEKKYRDYTGSRRFILILFARDRSKSGDFAVVPLKQYAADQVELRELRQFWHQSRPGGTAINRASTVLCSRQGNFYGIGACGLSADHKGDCVRVGVDFPA